MTRRTFLTLLATGSVWGASYLFIRVAVNDSVPTFQIVFVRCLAGAVVLNLALARQGKTLASVRTNPLVLLGFATIGTVLPFVLIVWAEARIDSGKAALLNATMPTFAALFAAAFLKDERLTRQTVAGLCLGLAGVFVLGGGQVLDFGRSETLGQVMVVAAAASYGAAAVLGRQLVRQAGAVALSTANVTTAAAMFAVPFFVGGKWRLNASPSAWASMIALGVLGTGIAYFWYYGLLGAIGSVRASLVTYIVPVVGVALGAAVLGESLHWRMLAGGILIALGVFVGTGAIAGLRRSRPSFVRA
jgi:drug/metabolite transporter (DMT)-like permease